MKKWELIERFLKLGGPGSGYHGHAGRPGKRGGSAPGVGGGLGVAEEVKSFVGRLTLTGGDIGGITISPEAREFLAQTVTKDSYKLYRGIGIIKGRVTQEQMNELEGLVSGDPVPDYLMKKGNPFASYTTKKGVARYYSEGKISLVAEAAVSKKDVVVVTRNLRSVLKKAGNEGIFSESDYDYFKDEAEVIVREPISATVMSIK